MAALRIMNIRGVPGTASIVARDSSARYLIANHHVVLGARAMRGDLVWALREKEIDEPSERVVVGRVACSHLGRITFEGELVFVDCALVELAAKLPTWVEGVLAGRPSAWGRAYPGQRVHKGGA